MHFLVILAEEKQYLRLELELCRTSAICTKQQHHPEDKQYLHSPPTTCHLSTEIVLYKLYHNYK